MKGNKMKVKHVPSAYTLWLARLIQQQIKTNRPAPLGKRVLKRGRATFGFNKCAMKMMDLGYKPKYAQYSSKYSWFDQ